jgi:hypothetical protein
MTHFQSDLPARDGFADVVRAEWTKFRSVRGTAWCLVLAVGLTVGVSVLIASSSKFLGNVPEPLDTFSFAHQPMTGDGSLTARVAVQDPSHPWAKAGLIVKETVRSGSRYAAMMVTPAHGARFETLFTTGVAGSLGAAPRWLKLTRTGDTITGYESPDGATWRRAGAVTISGLSSAVEIGLFVTSPNKFTYVRGGGRSAISVEPTVGRAVFDHVGVESASIATDAGWTYLQVVPIPRPGEPQLRPGTGGLSRAGDAFTITGGGDIAWFGLPSFATIGSRDSVLDCLQGVQIGLIVLAVLGVLGTAAEYRTGMIRSTFAANPRRGRVLAAKIVVVGGAAFTAGLVASTVAFLVTQPIVRGRGIRPPAYPHRSLAQPLVLRAVVGTAVFLALIAILALAIAAILRRSILAIPVVIGLVTVPQIVGELLSADASAWLTRVTPAAGLAIQQTTTTMNTVIGPWSGLGVLVAYSAAAVGFAVWRWRRGDA